MNERFETGQPASQPEIIAQFAQVHEACERFALSFPAAEVVQPQGEKWSPADHVRHLAKSTFRVAKALRLPKPLLLALFGASGGSSRSLPALREVYLEKLRAGGQAGRFAPSQQEVTGDPETYRREVLGRWRKAMTAVHTNTHSWGEDRRWTIPGPGGDVSDLGGMSELVEEGRGGWRFRAGDAADLAAKLEAILADPARLGALAPPAEPPPTFEAHLDAVEARYRNLG